MERQEGYYWVTLPNNETRIAEYIKYSTGNGYFQLTGIEDSYSDADFISINPTRIPSPDEVDKHRIIKNDTTACVGYAPYEIEEIFTLETGIEIFACYNRSGDETVYVGVKNQEYTPPLKVHQMD